MRKVRKLFGAVVALMLCAFTLFACAAELPPPDTGSDTGVATEGDVCTDIVIKQLPTKLEYQDGERFNPAGLLFDAVYENGYDGETDLNASDLDGWTPAGALYDGVKQVVLLFEGVQKPIDITVTPKTLLSMEITREPDTKSYSVGDPLDLSGLTVKASYEEGDVDAETRYTVTDADGNVYENGTELVTPSLDFELTVSVTAGDVTLTDTFSISVYAGFSLQAEDYWDPQGDKPRPTDKSYTILKGAQIEGWLVMTDCTFTGTGYIGNITAGVRLEFYIYSEVYLENAELVLVAAATLCNDDKQKMDDMQFNQFCKVYFGDDDEEIFIDDDVVIEGKPYPSEESGGSMWTNWADVPFGRYDIKPGYNRIVIDCVQGIKDSTGSARMPNIDRLDVRMTDGDTQGDFVTDITIKTPPTKTTYLAGEKFDPSGIVFDVAYRNGYDGDKDLGADRIRLAEDRPLVATDKKVTLKFKNYEFQVDVTVTERVLQSMEITALPNVTAYYFGMTLDLTGLKIKAAYEDGFIDENAVNYTIKDESGNIYTDGSALGTGGENGEIYLIAEITSGGVTRSAGFTVTIVPGIRIEAEGGTATDGKSYAESSGFWTWDNGTWTGTGYLTHVVKNNKIELHVYSDVAVSNAQISVRIASKLQDPTNKKMQDLRFNDYFKLYDGNNAEIGISDNAIVIGRPYSSGSFNDDVDPFHWINVNIAKVDLAAGENVFTLLYFAENECMCNIDRIDIVFAGDSCNGITIVTQPTKLVYLDGETFDPAGIVFAASYENGFDGDTALTADKLTVVTTRPLTVGDTFVTIRYKGCETTINVTVNARKVESVQITQQPTKTEYTSGDPLDLSGLTVKAVYEGGVVDEAVTEYTVKDENGKTYKDGDTVALTESGDITFTVEITSGGAVETAQFTVSVTVPVVITQGDIVTDITVTTAPTKTEYFIGETFDATGLVFDVVYRNGFDGDVGFTAEKAAVIDTAPLAAGDSSVTLSFKDFEFEIAITVVERKVQSVEVLSNSIASYPKGGVFDADALTVKAVYEGGVVNENVSEFVVKDAAGNVCADGYTVTQNGTFTVEVTSGGVTQSASFELTVFDSMTVQAEARDIADKQSYVKYTGAHDIWDNGDANNNDDTGKYYACRYDIGTTMTYYIYSDVAVKNARISMRAASTCYNDAERRMDDMQFNLMFRIYAGEGENKTEIPLPNDLKLEGKAFPENYTGDHIWFMWDTVDFATVDLAAGYTVITIEVIGKVGNQLPNIDRIDITFGTETPEISDASQTPEETAIIKERN